MPNADPVDEVIDSLDEASGPGLLCGLGEDFWAGQFESGRPHRGRGRSGLRAIAGLFGGAGQLQQLIVHDINGHNAAVSDIVEVNGGWTRCR